MDAVQYKVVHNERRGEPIMSAVFTFAVDTKSCPAFNTNPDYNRFFLNNVEAFATEVCQVRGHYMLNDLLDNLGIPRIKWGYRYGWLKHDEVKIEICPCEESWIFEVKIYTAGDIWDRL